MGQKFFNENAEVLYNRIVSLNKEIMEDKDSISLRRHNIINESCLINTCNTVYSDRPFSDPPEPFCEDFAEMTAFLIDYLNKGHCFADGNKRTTLLIIMDLIKEEYPVFYNEFFVGSLSNFLVDMLSKKLDYEAILEWVYKQYELRYSISDEEQTLLRIAVNYKREGLYEKSHEVYQGILNKYGHSSIMYKAIAKVLACEEQYEEAIDMFNKAIELGKSVKVYDWQSKYHKETLEKRNELSEKEFLDYMKSISGNKEYCFEKYKKK